MPLQNIGQDDGETGGDDRGFEAASPFEPQPADLGGCGKPAVVGCLLVLVLVAIGFMFFLFKVRDVLHWALAEYEQKVFVSLADDVTDDDRARLEKAFDSALAAIEENRINPESLQGLQRFMASPPKSNEPVDHETVRSLIEVLEAVGGVPSSVPEPEEDTGPSEEDAASRTVLLLRPSLDAAV